MNIILLFVSFAATTIGCICGIGGGVIIKPVLDMFQVYSATTISFMSSIIVLCMTSYSLIRNLSSGQSQIRAAVVTPLGIGAALGGILGKCLMEFVKTATGNESLLSTVQACALGLITLGTLLYTINKDKIATKKMEGMLLCCVSGLVMGAISSFLGIGGGPIDLVVLYYLFSMETKEAAQNSLYIIFLSQLANLLFTLFTGRVPVDVPWGLLALMASCGVLGGVVGRSINKKIDGATVHKLFIILMLVIILISIYNLIVSII